MRGRTSLLTVLLLSAFHSPVESACIEPGQLTHAAVGIARYFDDTEPAPRPGVIGVGATAWFLSPTLIVTAEHVAAGMHLSTREHKALEIRDGDDVRPNAARIQRVAGRGPEKLAVIELQAAVPQAHGAVLRTEPLVPEDPVVTMSYKNSQPRLVGGRFAKYGEEGRLARAALLEIFDGNDRLAIDYGASGAPVFDCEGRIAAVVTTVVTQNLRLGSGQMRVSTPWGTPNVLSVPIQELTETVETE